jgi:hypothetical protein
VFPSAARFDELRAWLVAEYEKPSSSRDAEAAAIFAELGLDEAARSPGPKRHLLESARFRALLAAEPPLARAA